MLEADGHLRTWAVDAPIEPEIDLPARPCPIIVRPTSPMRGRCRGQGEVWRIDSGSYRVLEWSDARVRVEIHGLNWSAK